MTPSTRQKNLKLFQTLTGKTTIKTTAKQETGMDVVGHWTSWAGNVKRGSR